jgi:thiamine-phosphate pyrophosphorylase
MIHRRDDIRRGLLLYLCTDQGYLGGRPFAGVIEEAIAGGVTMLQIREKDACTREFFETARVARGITKARRIPLVVNDRLDVALAVEADGLHIGQSDLPLRAARKIAGGKLFIGVSAGTVEDALAAEKDGADYIGAGAVFPTGSKDDAGSAIGLEGLARICAAIRIPVAAIGGISLANAAEVMKAGAAGIAVISAILAQQDIKAASEALKAHING